jgi:hypothetical protein
MANKTLPPKQQTNLAEVEQQGPLSLFIILRFNPHQSEYQYPSFSDYISDIYSQ